MPVLPIPMIIALLLAAFLVQRLATRERQPELLALIALCATVSTISALVRYYGVQEIRWLQPILATCIPPIAWLAFARATEGSRHGPSVWLHALGPLAAAGLVVFNSDLLDVLIPLAFMAYGIAVLVRLGKSEDNLVHTSLGNGAAALWAWRIVALSLIASALCDVVIAVTLARGDTGPVLWLPSIASSLSLLSLGLLSLTHAIETQADDGEADPPQRPVDEEKDRVVVAMLDDYVETHKPHLDPDLTLSRLARKLVIPAKQLSAAINRVKAENVSRYINRKRIEEACRHLAKSGNVTTAMLESGFNTKSNFNREFLRVTGSSPSNWLRQYRQTPPESLEASG